MHTKYAHETVAPAIGSIVTPLYCGRPVGLVGKPTGAKVLKVTRKNVHVRTVHDGLYVVARRDVNSLLGYTTQKVQA